MHKKPKYDPQKHHRRSIRLKGYDYSQAGAYFVTICVKDKTCLFGRIVNEEMHLNDAGQMIDKWWQKIPEKFPDIELGVYQIMPNHFHAIVINTGTVGADPRVRPQTPDGDTAIENTETEFVDAVVNEFNADETAVEQMLFGAILQEGEHVGSPQHVGSPLHRVVQWFKTMSTNEYIRNVKQNDWPAFNGKLWQRNYYEHIIRNEKSLFRISDYIIWNPINWQYDKYNNG